MRLRNSTHLYPSLHGLSSAQRPLAVGALRVGWSSLAEISSDKAPLTLVRAPVPATAEATAQKTASTKMKERIFLIDIKLLGPTLPTLSFCARFLALLCLAPSLSSILALYNILIWDMYGRLKSKLIFTI